MRKEKGMALDIEALGFTKEELQSRVIDQLCERLLYDGDYETKIQALVKEQVDVSIRAFAEQEVLPNVHEFIENLTLQATNQWGEAKGEPKTFTEYLVERAEAYLSHPVDYDGKPVKVSGYGSKQEQTRLTYIVDKYLHGSIKTAMETAVKNVNTLLAGALAETAKLKLAEISKSLKVSVKC
jgi:hypothetical protein